MPFTVARLQRRSMLYFWRANLSVLLGVIVGTAALTGALLVGDSMRGSLRGLALSRLGNVTHAVTGTQFFRAALADGLGDTSSHAEPAILLSGAALNPESEARANDVNVCGVQASFGGFGNEQHPGSFAGLDGRGLFVNDVLAAQLDVQAGDDVVLRISRPRAISAETLLGRRDDAVRSARLTVTDVIASDGIGAFSRDPRQFRPANAFVALETLQRPLDRRGQVNTILLHSDAGRSAIVKRIQENLTLEDVALRLRSSAEQHVLVLESKAMLLPPTVEEAARRAAKDAEFGIAPVISYLANRITRLGPAGGSEASIPYSSVAALDGEALKITRGRHFSERARKGDGNEILLNEWADGDLGAKIGETIRLVYYVTGPRGRLEEQSHDFKLVGVVAMDGAAVDPTLVPEYRGVTDAARISDWDPPFPVDLTRIRDKDERYWEKYHTAPKAFVTLADGEALWRQSDAHLGRYTSLRLRPTVQQQRSDAAERFERVLLNTLDPASAGLRVKALRQNALQAAKGSTDFSGLFIGFSFFLIASAAMLVALLFRLGVERRASQVGLLRALGFARRQVRAQLLAEGAAIACAGAVLGLLLAVAYAWLMLAGLRTWWSAAANAPFLTLHVGWLSLAIGFVASVLIALGSIAWSLRGLVGYSTPALLAGAVQSGRTLRSGASGRIAISVAVIAALLAVALIGISLRSAALGQSLAFFGSGAALLVAALAIVRVRLLRAAHPPLHAAHWTAWWRLGARNAPRNPLRSMLIVGLLASATFVITSLATFRLEAGTNVKARNSGAGGFTLYAESAAPLLHDLNTPDGREALNISGEGAKTLADCQVFAFRLREGDAASCLNLYLPTTPRLIGAPREFIERGGFSFAAQMPTDGQPVANPWRLLERDFPDGVIPAIGDEAAVLWQMHSDLGKDITIRDERGGSVTLRFVALLRNSVLQDELIISEANFRRFFPSIDGARFFLIETSPQRAGLVRETLERELAPFGFDAASTLRRLRDYLAVQNTYIATFQSLGGLGLVIGAAGLVAVLLRNVWERRSELALLQALGFSRRAIAWIVLSENTGLVLVGLLAGVVPALVAVAPALAQRPGALPWASLGATLLGVLLIGVGAAWVAIQPTLRSPLLPALRHE